MTKEQSTTHNLQLLKICGVTCYQDAQIVCQAIDNSSKYTRWKSIRFLLGIVFCETSKRHVSVEQAKQIVQVVKEYGHWVHVVGVFVHQRAPEIISICEKTDISIAQLHGKVSKYSLGWLPDELECIYVHSVERDGTYSSIIEYDDQGHRKFGDRDWLLFDSPGGGTGASFAWHKFQVPHHRKWILAGGIQPNNVLEALTCLSPPGIDVSSGVCQSDGIRKCPYRIQELLRNCLE
eukprot:jgi/Galph1/5136/GphlegSOOS_G3762.1